MYRYALKGQEQFQRTMPFVGTLALSGQTILICQIAKLIRALLSIFQTLKNIDVSLRPERAGAISKDDTLCWHSCPFRANHSYLPNCQTYKSTTKHFSNFEKHRCIATP